MQRRKSSSVTIDDYAKDSGKNLLPKCIAIFNHIPKGSLAKEYLINPQGDVRRGANVRIVCNVVKVPRCQ